MLTPKEQQRTNLSLVGVHPALVAIVQRAMQLCPQPFTVFEGLRTKERQMALMSMGASKTMESKHITGDAVDLVPLVDWKLSWTWEHIYPIADAMQQAARELPPEDAWMQWGGAWGINFGDSTSSAKDAAQGYLDRCRAIGKVPFSDGPHFELVHRGHHGV